MASKRKASSSNPFAALVQDASEDGSSSASSDSDSELAAPLAVAAAASGPADRQAGGTVAARVDPLVGLNADKSLTIGVSDADIEATYRVVELLGRNPNFFKLPQFKRLRAALHPLIELQMATNYSSSGNAFKAGTAHNKRRKPRDAVHGDADREAKLATLEQEYINQVRQLRACACGPCQRPCCYRFQHP